MKRSDRIKIDRVRDALSAVPFAQDGYGTKTAAVPGFVAFHKDMWEVRRACEQALYLILCPDPDLTPEEQERDFEETMKPAEDYIARRKAAGWPKF